MRMLEEFFPEYAAKLDGSTNCTARSGSQTETNMAQG